MKKLSTSQKSYIAGFLDGDGSVYVKLRKNDTYRYGYQVAPYIVFYQKKNYLKYLEKIKEVIGAGYIRIRKDGIAEYTIGDGKSLVEFAKQILPFSYLKSQQLKLLLEILRSKAKAKTAKDFIKVCEAIDRFKKLNYSKKRIQTADSVRRLLIKKGLLTP